MSFTVNNILDMAKGRLGIRGTTKYDTDFMYWINDFTSILQMEMAKLKTGFDETIQYMNLVANQYEYTIPGNIIFIRNVKFKYNDIYYDLPHKPELKDEDYNPTTPLSNTVCGFFFSGNEIHLRNAPAETVTNGLQFWGHANTTDIDDTADTISQHNHIRLLYILYLCKTYRDSEQDETVNKFDAEFAKNMELFRQLTAHRYAGATDVGYLEYGFQT